MQALSSCVTWPRPLCWKINRLTITLFTSVKYGHRGSIYLPNRPLSRTKPCSCLASKSPTYTHISSGVRAFCLIGEECVDSGRESFEVPWQATQWAFPEDIATHILCFPALLHEGTLPLAAFVEVAPRQQVLKTDPFICCPSSSHLVLVRLADNENYSIFGVEPNFPPPF